ncbi:MAG TPA: hypothetical protein DDY88_00320 [Actinobacteria bacterium]|nr:hypothetical protein [Actinomycetota bacterium]
MITWTIGAGGLLGSAIKRASQRNFSAPSIPWDNQADAIHVLRVTAQEFAKQIQDEDWAIVWAAGSASTSSSAAEAELELRSLTALTEAIREHRPAGHGVFFLTSSAGGIYAGAADPPFDEHTEPVPLSAYGELKFAQEQQSISALADVYSVIVGRLSNLYGPGQNLDKLQGLISRLALASVTRQPINMFVSLDTMRDYIFTDDAASICLYWMRKALLSNEHTCSMKIIASGQPVSLGYLIHLMQDITRTKVPVAFGSHASSAAQALDLRLRPTGGAEVERFIATPLAAGTKLVYLDIVERYQRGLN